MTAMPEAIRPACERYEERGAEAVHSVLQATLRHPHLTTYYLKSSVPNDWGGEECDVFTANLALNGRSMTAVPLLEGPSRLHPMKPTDLGRNGEQLSRPFSIPADIFMVQHCHNIGAAVRKQALAFTLQRSFTPPCQVLFVDGTPITARLLRAHGEWPSQPTTQRRRARS